MDGEVRTSEGAKAAASVATGGRGDVRMTRRLAPVGRALVAPAQRTASAVFEELAQTGRLREVPLEAIAPNARQPRRRFDEAALEGLAGSIAERGVLQPPVVRDLGGGRWELVAGERRVRAARLAGLREIAVLVKDVDAAGALEDAVLENVAREDLSPVEKAHAYATMIEDLALTREQIGRRVGCSRASISNHLRLLDLPDDVLELLDAGELSFAHGRALLLCDDHVTRRELARRAVLEGWSKRQLEEQARRAGAPRARLAAPRAPADQQAFAQRMADAVSQASGLDVRVHAAGDDAYTFMVRGEDGARALAERLGAEGLDEPL